MDLKGVLKDEETQEKEKTNAVRVHKKPIQLRDIENRSSNNRKADDYMSDEKIKKLLNKEKKLL